MLSSFMQTRKQLLSCRGQRKVHLDTYKFSIGSKSMCMEIRGNGSNLRPCSSSIEECRWCMSEPALGHSMVSFKSSFDIIFVDANRHAHQHVLRSFHNLSIDFEKVRPFQGFETKVIIIKVPIIDYFTVQPCCILRKKMQEFFLDVILLKLVSHVFSLLKSMQKTSGLMRHIPIMYPDSTNHKSICPADV